MNRKLLAALRALAGQIVPGPLEVRLEAVIDAETNAVIEAMAEDMIKRAGKPRQMRSTAVRLLLKRGAQGMLDDARPRAAVLDDVQVDA